MTVNFDVNLIHGLIHGDINSYEKVFSKYYGKIFGFTRALVKDHWVAEEITQNVFLKLWMNRNDLSQNSNLNAYLFSIARNEAIDHFRSKQRFSKYQLVTEFRESEEMQINYDSELMQHVVENTIQQMPKQRQRIYVMSRKKNMSNDEIAILLRLSKRTVEKHISLALQQIRIALSKIEFWILLFFIE